MKPTKAEMEIIKKAAAFWGAQGGHKTSAAKVAASRANGAKGGRPVGSKKSPKSNS
jgi:hypothetical protein